MSDDSDETEIPDFEELNKDAEVDRNPNKPPKYSDLPACDICGQRYDFTVPEKVVEFSDERYRHFDTTKWICTNCYLDELKNQPASQINKQLQLHIFYSLQQTILPRQQG